MGKLQLQTLFTKYNTFFCKFVLIFVLICITLHSLASPVLYRFIRVIPLRQKLIKLDPLFLEKALITRNIQLDELPISANRKAVLHLTENFKPGDSCHSCNKVQQKILERAITANILDAIGLCNFLVFGVGFDSIMWTALNPGRTVFLEDNELWIKEVKKNAPFLEIYKVDYTVREKQYPQSLDRWRKERNCHPWISNEECFLMLKLPKEIRNISWSVIMVDAPNGHTGKLEAPTRQMSIFTAAILARANKDGAHVLVHDIHREIERVFSDEFLCSKNLIEELGRSSRLFSGSRLALRHYYIGATKKMKFFRNVSSFC